MPDLNTLAVSLVQQLCGAVDRLNQTAVPLRLPPLDRREWYELLLRKLKPQVGANPYLVVAVVGGTNIGKSVIFNHIAGRRISATTPIASGTKHPTALIHPFLAQQLDLSATFPGFTVSPWEQPDQPLQDAEQHLLFYQVTDTTPQNLIILDTPDVDSVAVVNWERAAHVRQSADVLIAVLTQQKYNDAAIKDFFRSAAAEGKLVIVIFNQCLLPDDETYWPLWLNTFCTATGVSPELVYVAPNDRRAAESNSLPFFERPWPASAAIDSTPHLLLNDLSQLKFEEIRTRALTGAVRHIIHPETGIPSWLREIDRRSHEFADALKLLASDQLAQIDRWPRLPNAVLIEQVRDWWRHQREGWAASVHGFYNGLSQLVSLPVKLIRQRTSSEPNDLIEEYREREWQAILDALESCFSRLERIRDLGNPLLTEQISQLLNGISRAEVIEQLRQEHSQLDLTSEVRQLVQSQLQQFRTENPTQYRLFRNLDASAAAVRPVISIGLFVTGAGPVGNAVAPLITDAAINSMLHLAGDAVGGTVAVAVGDKVLGDAASQGSGFLETKFRQLHDMFTQRRALWLSERLNETLLQNLPGELAQAAEVWHSVAYTEVRQLVQKLHELST